MNQTQPVTRPSDERQHTRRETEMAMNLKLGQNKIMMFDKENRN